jgi:hypothetical protein
MGRSEIVARLLAEAEAHRAASDSIGTEMAALAEQGTAARAALLSAETAVRDARAAHQAWALADERHRYSLRAVEALGEARAALTAWEALPVPAAPSPELAALEAWEAADRAAVVPRERLSAALADLAVWEATTPPEDVSARARELDEMIAEVRAYELQLAAAQEEARRLSLAVETAAHARAFVAACRAVRDEMAAGAYLPIHERASLLLDGADGLPVPYFAGPDDYGAAVHGARVPYAALSESEQRITAAAMVYALASVAGCPVRLVILDGLEVVEPAHRGPLVRSLVDAQQAGRVDSVVLTMASSPGEDLSYLRETGATVHEVAR